jgi:hypothetical protein
MLLISLVVAPVVLPGSAEDTRSPDRVNRYFTGLSVCPENYSLDFTQLFVVMGSHTAAAAAAEHLAACS